MRTLTLVFFATFLGLTTAATAETSSFDNVPATAAPAFIEDALVPATPAPAVTTLAPAAPIPTATTVIDGGDGMSDAPNADWQVERRSSRN